MIRKSRTGSPLSLTNAEHVCAEIMFKQEKWRAMTIDHGIIALRRKKRAGR
jgi:hypothetical protein